MLSASRINRFRSLSQTPIRFFILVAFSIFGFFTGCKDAGTESREPGNTKYIISFQDNLAPSGKTITVTLRSVTVYGMSGYHIISSIVETGSHITLRIDGIQAPEMSAAIPDVARAAFELGILANGVYAFDTIIDGSIIHSTLTVSDAALTFLVPAHTYLAASRPVLLRVPPTIIWGRVESFTTEEYQVFLDSLQKLGTSDVALPPGDYNYFSLTADGIFNYGGAMGRAYGQNFIYRYSGDMLAVRNLVQRFAKKYSDSIDVQLYGGRGEMYYSSSLKLEP